MAAAPTSCGTPCSSNTLTPCSSVSVAVSPASPSNVGTTVSVTTHAYGCPDLNPLYQFSILAPVASSYQVVQVYSTSPTFTWKTTGLVTGTYRFSVWVRDVSSGGAFGSSVGGWEASYSSAPCTP
jgi:hypothetical protein